MSFTAVLLRLMDCRPFRGRRLGEEDILAEEVGSFLRASTLEGKLKATWTSIPHEAGGKARNSSGFKVAEARYAKMKAQGLITGSADYVFVWPEGGGWIELKAKRGSLSPAQRDFRDWCVQTETRWAVCRDLEDVKLILTAWGIYGR